MRLPFLMLIIRGAAVLGAVLAAYLMLDPRIGLPAGWDKLAHAVGFYGITLAALFCTPWHRKGEVIRAVALIAAMSEFAQTLTGRDMDAWDLAADLAGLGLATLPVYVAAFRQYAQRARHQTTAARRRRSDAGARAQPDLPSDGESTVSPAAVLTAAR